MTAPNRPLLATLFSVLGLLGLASVSARASGQDKDEPGESAPARDSLRDTQSGEDDAPSVVFDPTLVERLSELQANHRKARDEALKDPKAWDDNRALRAQLDRAELGQLWGNLVNSPDAQARLRLHADRMARLNRMLDLAQGSADAALSKRIRADIERELVLHAQNMQTLRSALRLQ